jgi:hypothetical protein
MCSDCFDGLKAQLAAEKTRADDLSRMVAAMGEAAREFLDATRIADLPLASEVERLDRAENALDAILSRPDVAAERGRWRKVDDADAEIDCGQAGVCATPPGCQRHWAERNAELVRERDAAIACAEKWTTEFGSIDNALSMLSARREALAKAEASRDELGIQLAALQAEHARLMKGLRDVEGFMLREWRPPAEAVLAMVREVAAGGPAVPGDALASAPGLPPPPVRVPTPALGVAIRTYEAEHDIGPALDRAHEASGVVTQKGGEK